MVKKATILLIWPKRLLTRPSLKTSLPLVLAVLALILLLVDYCAPFWWPYSLFTLSPASHSLRGKIIVIDPGHGGTDPGAKYQGLLEKHINLDISLKVAQLLRKQGAKITLTRTTDVDFYKSGLIGTRREKKRSELNERVRLAEELNADLFLSIHTNKDRHPTCYGIETFYHPQSSTGRVTAEILQEELRKLQPRNQRLAKAGDYYLLRNTAMPALIVEVGFLSHAEERKLLQTANYQQKIAEAITTGLQKYYANSEGNKAQVGKVPKRNQVMGKQQPISKTSTQATATDSSPVLRSSFGTDRTTLELYFLTQSPSGDQLALEQRAYPGVAPVSAQVATPKTNLKAMATYAIEELIKGPVQSTLEPIFPEGSKLLSLELAGSTVQLNFSHEMSTNFKGSLAEENYLLLAIYKTLSQFPEISAISLQVAGQEVSELGGHIVLNAPIQAGQLERQAKIAVVIDDLGQNYPGTAEMMALPYPITFAIMPNLANTQQEASQAVKLGHQVIIHMPMAPENGKARWLGPGALLVGLPDEEVAQRIRVAINQLPEAVGLSNHTGSKITADRRTMQIVLQELKAKNLFILDSRTTDKTVIPELAQKMGLPYAERTVFLDNLNSTASIKKQLDLLAVKALENGEAIGIGHVGVTGVAMAKALQDRLPQLKAQGITVVPVSELAKKH